MSHNLYLAFVAACIALALLPGPVVTLIIANGLRHGTRAALVNLAGVQAGLAIVIAVVAVGLTSLMATMGYWFDWVRFAGAAYLVWLGIKLIRAPAEGLTTDAPPPPPRGAIFPAGISGTAVESENTGVLRRLHSAVHGHGQGSLPAGRVARRHLHGDRRTDRPGLRAACRPGTAVLFPLAHPAAVAHLRRLHDRRWPLAGADKGAGKSGLHVRPERRRGLAKNARQAVGPLLLTRNIRDQVLADFDAAIHQPARLAVHRNGVVGCIIHRVRLVVADHQITLGAKLF